MGRNNIAFIIIGIVALATGVALRLFVGRRRFYRRNQAGLQGFKSYRNALLTPFVESILMYVGWLLNLIGALLLAAAAFVGR